MYTLLAVTLPSALAASILTVLWLKRRRIRAMCSKLSPGAEAREPKEADGGGYDTGDELQVRRVTGAWGAAGWAGAAPGWGSSGQRDMRV